MITFIAKMLWRLLLTMASPSLLETVVRLLVLRAG